MIAQTATEGAGGVWTSRSPSAGRKHVTRVWRHGPAAWGVSCTCGFAHVPTSEVEARALEVAHARPGFVHPRDEEPAENATLVTSRGEEVPVAMTDEEAAAALSRKAAEARERGRPNGFAEDLAAGFAKHGSWTEKQRPWAHKLANEQAAHETAAPEEPEDDGRRFPRLVEMLTQAGARLKHPRMVARFDEGAIRVNLAGARARFPGSVNVTSDGQYEDRAWYGRVHEDGRFEPSSRCPDWVTEALVAFDRDPAGAASLQGQRYGSCCFCGKELTTSESLAVGYGPICAAHYGLPWG